MLLFGLTRFSKSVQMTGMSKKISTSLVYTYGIYAYYFLGYEEIFHLKFHSAKITKFLIEEYIHVIPKRGNDLVLCLIVCPLSVSIYRWLSVLVSTFNSFILNDKFISTRCLLHGLSEQVYYLSDKHVCIYNPIFHKTVSYLYFQIRRNVTPDEDKKGQRRRQTNLRNEIFQWRVNNINK